MRKFFGITYLALLLGVCLACNKESVPEEPQGIYPILFRTSGETRAVATEESMQEDANGFDVYAFFTSSSASDGLSFDKNVKYLDGSWTYQHSNQDLEYWLPGATYWFKAVYPKTINYNVDNSTKDQKLTISGFDITTQHDILVATTGSLVVDEVIQAPASGSVVELLFQHLLANVTIKVKSQIEGVTIQNIKLSGVDTNCEYSGNAWTISGNTTYIEYTKSTALSKGADFVDVTGGGILVIPAASNKQLTIQANKTYNLTLPAGTWESGNRYTYTLEIKQDDIVFVDDAPYVEEWDSENATGSVIIK